MQLYLVHKNTELWIFDEAERGKVALFYDPIGELPCGSVDETTFLERARYWVPHRKAWQLCRCIQEGKEPAAIVQELNLHYRDPYDVRDELQDPIERQFPIPNYGRGVIHNVCSAPLGILVKNNLEDSRGTPTRG